jgi:hypothetical protein
VQFFDFVSNISGSGFLKIPRKGADIGSLFKYQITSSFHERSSKELVAYARCVDLVLWSLRTPLKGQKLIL